MGVCMKGIRMLISIFPPLAVGGAERQAERLAKYLVSRNIPVGIITRRIGKLPYHEKMEGFEVYRIWQSGPARVRSIVFIIGTMLKLIQHSDSFDVLHAHLAFAPAVAACLAGRLLNKAVIVKLGGSGEFGDVQELRRTWRGRRMLKLMSRWANVYIALTTEMETEMLSAGFAAAKIVRMVNGVDTDFYCPSEDKQTDKGAIQMTDKIVILFTGRFVAVKSLPTLVLAFAHVVHSVDGVHLVLVGEGDEWGTLERMVNDLGITSKVTIIHGNSDVRPYLQGSDIFVLPSLSEGISNSLLEAMASGLACIATNVGGSSEVLEGGTYGILVPPNNIDQLTDAIIRLASNPIEIIRLGDLARRRVVNHYSLDVVGMQYLNLYERLVKG
jgi:glycosyltransferase involved in cell wall biosynthesis